MNSAEPDMFRTLPRRTVPWGAASRLASREWATASLLAPAVATCASALMIWACRGDNAPPAALAAAGAPAVAAPREPARRVLLIGVDAADEEMITPLVEKGRLPNFARFFKEGVTGKLLSHKPLLSPILWTSIATGVSPEKHEILDFVEAGAGGATVPVGSRLRRSRTFWEIVGASGVEVAVVGWLATFPATPVNGWLVSDRFTIHPYEPVDTERSSDPTGKTYPPALFHEIEGLAVGPSALTVEELKNDFGPRSMDPLPGNPPVRGSMSPDERALRVISSTARTYAAVAVHLLREKRPGLTAVYFDGIDRLLHLFSDVASPPLRGSDPARVARFGHVGESFYEAMDRIIGRLVEAAGPETTVLLVSDHGWKTARARPTVDPRREGPFAAEWHRDSGVIMAEGRAAASGRCEGADIYDVAPTILAIYGLPPAVDFRGKPLACLFESGFLASSPRPAAPYTRALSQADGPIAAPGRAASPSPEERTALENLQGLGYVAGKQAAGGAGEGEARDRRQANLATVYLEERRYAEAAALYDRFLISHPGDYDALYNLGYARRQAGEIQAARTAYLDAARARPTSAAPWVAIAEVESSEGRWKEAWGALESARRIEPGEATIWNQAGTVACEMGRIAEGLKCFQRAITLRPEAPSPYLNLARVLDTMGRGEEALSVLRRGLAAAPGDERLRRRLAELSARAKKPA